MAVLVADASGGGGNLVFNGAFVPSASRPGEPEAWSVSGNREVQQGLALDTNREGRTCARLTCTAFQGQGPDHHAMLCQVGRVTVQRGQWYRLTFTARSDAIDGGDVSVSLVNTRQWRDVGLNATFLPKPLWSRFEFVFRSAADLPASASRLQFWFKSTGTLWLDDVRLDETENEQRWFPEIPAGSGRNLLPNSSFECGDANWGSYTWGIKGWGGNLFRLEGDIDSASATHGGQSLRISLDPQRVPVFYFDYYEPVRQPVQRVLAANRGWFRVAPGEPLTLSASLRADAPDTMAQLAGVEPEDHISRQAVSVGTNWQRAAFTFRPAQPFVFIAVGLDLEATRRATGTLWIDAVQLERGEQATAYAPRETVESFISSATPGNIFTNPAEGACIALRACNDGAAPQTLRGRLRATDFFDATAFDSAQSLVVPPHGATAQTVSGLARDRRGFLRVEWTAPGASNALRCAVIDPADDDAERAVFGMNHAYPWDFLLRLARQAGVAWWRDWSAKWDTVEHAQGRIDFTAVDPQIERVIGRGNAVDVLLPFPSAAWSTTARAGEVDRAAGRSTYLRSRLPLAYAPRDLDDFGRYAATVVRHCAGMSPRPMAAYQVLNEALCTDYALPARFGYGLADYVKLLAVAYRSMKAEDPACRVVGGLGTGPDSELTRAFVATGGLAHADALDVHIYHPPRPPEWYERVFGSLEKLMREHGGVKPVWITEWGCYADDDPPCFPATIGDATMNRCRWPDERAATEHIVRFATIGLAHGVQRIFFHAGTCGAINGPDAGGVFFEYGGAPRRMYPGVAAFTRLVGVPEAFVRRVAADRSVAYIFRARGRAVAVAWTDADQPAVLRLPAGVTAWDIMGNRLTARAVDLGTTPIYLTAPSADALSAVWAAQ